MKLFFKIFFLIILMSFSFITYAQNMALRHSPRIMQGIRPTSMGGAFIAMDGTDENALFYNPAAINDYEKKVHMQFLLPSLEFSYKGIPFLSSNLVGLAGDLGDADGNDAEQVRIFDRFSNLHTGRFEEVAAHGSIATFMHKFLAASLFYDNRTSVYVVNPVTSTIQFEAISHFGLQVGSSYSFFEDALKVGASLKFIGRHLIDDNITARDIINSGGFGNALDLERFGFGIGGDIGIKAKMPFIKGKAWQYLDPTFAVTVQNIGDTRFFVGDDVGRLKESTTAGFALHPNYWKLKTALAVDFTDLERRTDIITKLHAGYEVSWPDISKAIKSMSVRIGTNQGYITGGFGMDFKYFKFNLATYGREVGEKTHQKESRMYGFQLAAGF
ncbi:hypothetical protein K1X76_05570 [bacterium]|nr:hypothetical protein [bacterium]